MSTRVLGYVKKRGTIAQIEFILKSRKLQNYNYKLPNKRGSRNK